MFGCRHVRHGRFGHRPRQLVDSVNDVIVNHLLGVHSRESLKNVCFPPYSASSTPADLAKFFFYTRCVRKVAASRTVQFQQGLSVVVVGDGYCRFHAVAISIHPEY